MPVASVALKTVTLPEFGEPTVMRRIEARRAFMSDVLGIQLKPEVLPFSNIPAFLPPFWLSRNSAMAVAGR